MMRELIEFFGGTTYVLLLLTVTTGLLRWKWQVSWAKPKYHFVLAVLMVITATTHLILMNLR